MRPGKPQSLREAADRRAFGDNRLLARARLGSARDYYEEDREALMIITGTGHSEPSLLAIRRLDQDGVSSFGDIDRHPGGGRRSIVLGSHR